ncbi:hypothetical protein [Caulobacter sp. UC70_42]|uniref:hypothetical protein n=1 Tax=Caulobacter sp. UC70_42 TaxID=3374551 RepID=UPI003758096B
MNWDNLETTASAIAAIGSIITAACLLALWLHKQRKEATSRLSVRLLRPENEIFQVEVAYAPKSWNEALFAELGSLGDNPIHLLPKLHLGLPQKMEEEWVAAVKWPKEEGQWESRRMSRIENSNLALATFRIVPQTTDGGGWLYVRIHTGTPRRHTLVSCRVPVSVL